VFHFFTPWREDGVLEDDLDSALVSAFSALAGATIGGLTSFSTTFFTQRAQLRNADRASRKAKLESLYNDFIAEAARVYVDALTHQTEKPTRMVHLYALVGRMRLVSARPVIDAAMGVMDHIRDTYLAPNRTLDEIKNIASAGGMDIVTAFSEACRDDLAGRAQ
jgi:hypothetical protein